ncbi:MAG TPA: hypothetical protein PKO06_23180, partial [Candidatus Ozemobacteraceae bacterium]|nr:hypothetical protein [Candidatus Ozemobacteraceae bacterium]
EGEHVELTFIGRSHPDAADFWDGNWLGTRVTARAGGFRAAFEADLRAEEIGAFHEALVAMNRSLSGDAEFLTLEQQVALTLSMNHTGQIAVSGTLTDQPGVGNQLLLSFEIDQTYLHDIITRLECILEAFPQIGTPDAEA